MPQSSDQIAERLARIEDALRAPGLSESEAGALRLEKRILDAIRLTQQSTDGTPMRKRTRKPRYDLLVDAMHRIGKRVVSITTPDGVKLDFAGDKSGNGADFNGEASEIETAEDLRKLI